MAVSIAPAGAKGAKMVTGGEALELATSLGSCGYELYKEDGDGWAAAGHLGVARE